MNNIEKRFEECQIDKPYKRIDEYHPIDLYVGYNKNQQKSFACVSYGKIEIVESSKAIEVEFIQRTDNKIMLSFNLLDSNCSDIFYKFCENIVDSTRELEIKNPLKYIIERWNYWLTIFKKMNSRILNESEIKGVLGELIFLNEYMLEKYGETKAISSWLGASKSHKDFEIEDTWYEVKCVKENATTLKISSLEQLESNTVGFLAVIKLEPSNEFISEAITINDYIDKIRVKIKEKTNKQIFDEKLIEANYYFMKDYDKYIYSKKGKSFYVVNSSFPKINKSDLRKGIVKASYELEMTEIKSYEVNLNSEYRGV